MPQQTPPQRPQSERSKAPKATPRTSHLLLGALCAALYAPTVPAQPDKPLPAVHDLQTRALDNFRKMQVERERYLCREDFRYVTLDGKGQPRKTETMQREVFFVNRFEITQTLSRDGKPLSAGDQAKEQERVRQAIEAAQTGRKPKEQGIVLSAGDVLRMANLTHERRILVAGRPTIVFDISSDPNAHAASIAEKLMRAMQGTVSIDESTGNVQDINAAGTRDVKVGGGLVATIHRGYRIHMLAAPQPGGVWLLTLAEGTGDARIGLFVHEGTAYRQESAGCRLFNVTAEGQVKAPPANPQPAPR